MDTTRASLLIRIRDRGDSAAWRDFDDIYRPILLRFALARGIDRTAAEDVVQYCMVQISEYIGDFHYDPTKGRFKAWLRTMVNNHIRNLARRLPAGQAESHAIDIQEGRGKSPEILFDQIWMAEHLRHCLQLVRKSVDESTYTAFLKYVIEERPVEQVCQELNMTVNQVQLIKWRLTRKLAEKMKTLLGEED